MRDGTCHTTLTNTTSGERARQSIAIHLQNRERIMPEPLPSREQAHELLCHWVKDEKLRIHAYCVEGVMRYLARKHGEDEDVWGTIGLVHDIDYEKFPEEHCKHVQKILGPAGWPEWSIRAVISHGWGICSDVEPESLLEKCLFAFDELTGLVYATALVRPSRSVADMKPKSVKKKWKVKSFAAGANREIIQQGADMLGMPLEELFIDCIQGMRDVEAVIGLGG